MDDVYCNECGSCGEDGCCTPLKCAYNNMVKKSSGLYCELNFQSIKFNYKLAERLYNKYQDKELFDELWNEIHNDKKEIG